MKAYNAITVVCVLIMVAAGFGTAYAQYSSTLSDTETIGAENHYGTATLTGTPGAYTLTYTDTTADSVYLTVKVAGLSSDFAIGTIMDLWLGGENAAGEFGTTYRATVDGSTLVSLNKRLSASGSTYTDGDVSFVITCTAGTISVTKGGSPIAVTNGNFHDGTSLYRVTAAGDTVSDVCRIIPVNGSSGSYSFDDGGYKYAFACAGSSVTSASKCVVVSSAVDSMGVVTFNTASVGLTQKSWNEAIALYSGGSPVSDLGSYNVQARFYSTGGLE